MASFTVKGLPMVPPTAMDAEMLATRQLGYWDTGLFESDVDLLIAEKFGGELFLPELEKTAQAALGADTQVHYSLYAPRCTPRSSVTHVRNYLQMTGFLKIIHDVYTAQAKAPGASDPQRPIDFKNQVIILGACFMILGCSIPASMLQDMKDLLPGANLKHCALQQMNLALYGHGGGPPAFVGGTPYDFKAKTYSQFHEEGGHKQYDPRDLINSLQRPARIHGFATYDWGSGLFESDDHYRDINFLSLEAGLLQLQTTDRQASASNEVINYSIFRPFCTNPAKVAAHLNSGVLPKLHNKYMTLAHESRESIETAAFGRRFRVIYLGLCATSLGCRIPLKMLLDLHVLQRNTKLRTEESTAQFRNALLGPNIFVPGVPYDFGAAPRPAGLGHWPAGTFALTPAENQRMASCSEHPGYDAALRTLAGIIPLSHHAAWRYLSKSLPKRNMFREDSATALQEALKFPAQSLCGNCGSEQGKAAGGALQNCARCKWTRYCGVECQEAHWEAHKMICKTLVIFQRGK